MVAGSMNAPPVNTVSNSPPNPRCTWRSKARLSPTFGRPRVSSLFSPIMRLRISRFHPGNSSNFAHKRPDEPDHEINGVVGGQNAQITHARPEGIQGRQRHALLQVIFMGEHA